MPFLFFSLLILAPGIGVFARDRLEKRLRPEGKHARRMKLLKVFSASKRKEKGGCDANSCNCG